MSTFPFGGDLGRTSLLFSLGVALILSDSPLALAQKRHPVEEKGVASQKNVIETSISFYNRSQQTIKVYWLNLEGKRELKHVLKASERTTQTTFLTHPWLPADEKDNALGLYYPDAEKRLVTYGGAPAGAPGGGNDKTAYFQMISEASFGKYKFELGHIARNPDVQAELKMTPEQIQKAVTAEIDVNSTPLRFDDKSTLESATRTYAARSRAVEKALTNLLTAEQRKRFGQIMLQIVDSPNATPSPGMRPNSASYPEVAEAIKLTAEQKTKLIKGTKPADILNDEQKAVIQTMSGEPYKGRTTTTGVAPKGGGGVTGFTSPKLIYLKEAAVQSELKMSEEQIAKVKALAAKQLEANSTNFSGPPAERLQKARGLSKEMEEGVSALLTAVQSKRLEQVARQHRGVKLFTDKTLVGSLKLTPDQQEKLKKVQAQYASDLLAASLKNPAGSEAYGKQFVEVRAATINAAAGLLTAQQKVVWQDYVGEPFPHYMPSLPRWLVGGTP